MVSQLWPAGTIWATAMTPVVVSVVKEALERPAQKITQVGVVGRYHHDPDELVVEEVEPGASEPSERRLYGVRRHKWRIAVVTGLLAAAVAIAALTLPELVAGRSIVSGGKKTTVLGGHRHKAKQKTTTTTVETVTQTQTETTTTTPATTPTETTPTTTTTTPTQTETTPAPPATTVPPATTTQPAP